MSIIFAVILSCCLFYYHCIILIILIRLFVYLIVMLVFMLSDTKKNGSRAFLQIMDRNLFSYLSSISHLGIINTVTDDNNSRVAYAFHFFFFSTIKNGLSHFAFSFTCVCFIRPLLDFNITTHAHARILYDCNSSHVPSKNAKDFQFVLIVMCKFLLHFIFVTLL